MYTEGTLKNLPNLSDVVMSSNCGRLRLTRRRQPDVASSLIDWSKTTHHLFHHRYDALSSQQNNHSNNSNSANCSHYDAQIEVILIDDSELNVSVDLHLGLTIRATDKGILLIYS